MAAIGNEQINNYIRQMTAPLATLTGMNASMLEMESEGRIVEVVLGTEFQTIIDERAIIN